MTSLFGNNKAHKLFNLYDNINNHRIKAYESMYQNIFDIPMITNGWFASNVIYLKKSQKNTRQANTRTFMKTFVRMNNADYMEIPMMCNIKGTNVFPSKLKRYNASISSVKIGDDSKTCIDIYDVINGTLISSIIENDKVCGKIFGSSPFCSVSWSNNDEYIAFIAERIVKKSKCYLDSETEIILNDNKMDDSDKKNDDIIGNKYCFEETWGEQMSGAKNATFYIYDVKKNKLYNFDDKLPENVVLTDVQFVDDNKSVIIQAYDVFPRRFGLKFYNTRPSQIWWIKFDLDRSDIDIINLLPNEFSPQSPRLINNGKTLLYLTTEKYGL